MVIKVDSQRTESLIKMLLELGMRNLGDKQLSIDGKEQIDFIDVAYEIKHALQVDPSVILEPEPGQPSE